MYFFIIKSGISRHFSGGCVSLMNKKKKSSDFVSGLLLGKGTGVTFTTFLGYFNAAAYLIFFIAIALGIASKIFSQSRSARVAKSINLKVPSCSKFLSLG